MPGWLVSLALSHFTVVTFLLMGANVAPVGKGPFPGQAAWKEGGLRGCVAGLALLGTCCPPSRMGAAVPAGPLGLCCACVGQLMEVWSQPLVFTSERTHLEN